MKLLKIIQAMSDWDKQGRYVFLTSDLTKLFGIDNVKNYYMLNRLVKDGILQRACREIYVNPHAASFDSFTVERIAKLLRRGHYNYISLESMLSEYGVISQIPMDRLTVMTTGRKGVYKTLYGTIEFTHTKRTVEDILENTILMEGRPLRIAKKQTAWRDLKRVGRNIQLVNEDELYDE